MKYPIALVAYFLAMTFESSAGDARQEAGLAQQIAQVVPEYRVRPTRKFVNGRTAGDFQPYVDSCLGKIVERVNQSYPSEAKGKLYGDVRIAFSIGTTGNILDVEVESSSGSPILNRALVRAVRESSPCPAIPTSTGTPLDILVVKQLFSFSKNDRVELLP